MKKKWSLWIGLLFTILIINMIVIDGVIFLYKFNLSNFKVSTVVSLVEIIVPTLNIGWLVFLFIDTQKDRKDARNIEIKQYWYHEIILKGNINLITCLFSTCESFYEPIKSNSENVSLKDLMAKFKKEYRKSKDCFEVLLPSIDEEFGKTFIESYSTLEDSITMLMLRVYNDNMSAEEYYMNIKNEQNKIYKLLVKYDYSICK